MRPVRSQRRFQFRLAHIFVVTLLAAVISAILADLKRRDAREEAAVVAACRLGGSVTWENEHGSRWLPRAKTCVGVCMPYANIESSDLAFLFDLPNLRRLQLSAARVGHAHMLTIGRLPSLEFLNIGGAEISDADLAMLRQCENLHELRFTHSQVTGRGFSSLSGLPCLESVDVDGDQLEDEALFYLAESRSLRVLEVAGDRLSDDGLRSLSKSRSLEVIVAVGDFTAAPIRLLLAMPRLKRLAVGGRGGFSNEWQRTSDGEMQPVVYRCCP